MKIRIDFYPHGIGKIKDVSFYVVKQTALLSQWQSCSPRFETLADAKEYANHYDSYEYVGIYVNAAKRIEEVDIQDYLQPIQQIAAAQYQPFNEL